MCDADYVGYTVQGYTCTSVFRNTDWKDWLLAVTLERNMETSQTTLHGTSKSWRNVSTTLTARYLRCSLSMSLNQNWTVWLHLHKVIWLTIYFSVLIYTFVSVFITIVMLKLAFQITWNVCDPQFFILLAFYVHISCLYVNILVLSHWQLSYSDIRNCIYMDMLSYVKHWTWKWLLNGWNIVHFKLLVL